VRTARREAPSMGAISHAARLTNIIPRRCNSLARLPTTLNNARRTRGTGVHSPASGADGFHQPPPRSFGGGKPGRDTLDAQGTSYRSHGRGATAQASLALSRPCVPTGDRQQAGFLARFWSVTHFAGCQTPTSSNTIGPSTPPHIILENWHFSKPVLHFRHKEEDAVYYSR